MALVQETFAPADKAASACVGRMSHSWLLRLLLLLAPQSDM